jgi:hypothetical protein
MVYKTGGLFYDIESARGVASYFNRRRRTLDSAVSSTSTTSTSFVATAAGFSFLAWADEAVDLALSGYGANSAGANTATSQLRLNAAVPTNDPGVLVTSPLANYIVNLSYSKVVAPSTDDLHSAFAYLKTSAGTLTYSVQVSGAVWI